MPKRSKGARLNLGEPWASDLADFCVAHYGVAETNYEILALIENGTYKAFTADNGAKIPIARGIRCEPLEVFEARQGAGT